MAVQAWSAWKRKPLSCADPVVTELAMSYNPVSFLSGEMMQSKPVLTLDDLKKIAAAAEAEAKAHNWAVTISIVDDGGHLLWLQRLDGAAPVSASIAPAKARTAALGRRETRVYEEMINNGRFSFLSAPVVEGMLEGGVPIIVSGQCVGAVGVSGVKSAEDVQIARAGIAALQVS
jgi:uncharacterized protein GlcG (DUF336 family)